MENSPPGAPYISPEEFNIIQKIVSVLASDNKQTLLLFFFKAPNGEYNFAGHVPDATCIDSDFVVKFGELTKQCIDSMITPADNFNTRVNNLLTRWRKKFTEAELKKLPDGGVEVEFKK
jgi:hypothetical protein